MCELQYGTAPSLELGESPRPRSPMIVLYGTPGFMGIVFIALSRLCQRVLGRGQRVDGRCPSQVRMDERNLYARAGATS
jgi:hypothetical protein